MSYTYLATCDSCGSVAPPFRTKEALSDALDRGGWIFVRHEGRHYCSKCAQDWRASQAAKPVKRTQEMFLREKQAASDARAKVALRMRASGMTFSQIGKALGVSGSRASQICAIADARGIVPND